jgi:hypothetical protein
MFSPPARCARYIEFTFPLLLLPYFLKKIVRVVTGSRYPVDKPDKAASHPASFPVNPL